MDYGLNGIFKQIMFGKKALTLDGLKKVGHQVWANFSLQTCSYTMTAWGERLKLMLENSGSQMENLKKESSGVLVQKSSNGQTAQTLPDSSLYSPANASL